MDNAGVGSLDSKIKTYCILYMFYLRNKIYRADMARFSVITDSNINFKEDLLYV